VVTASPDLRQGFRGNEPTQQHELASLGVEPEKEGGAKDVLSWD